MARSAMTMSQAMKRRAYRVAASILSAQMDSGDLTDDLSTADDDRLREYIRRHVVQQLEKRGREPTRIKRRARG